MIKNVDWVVSVSSFLKEELMNKFRICGDRIIVEPMGVRQDFLGLGVSKNVARRMLGLKRDEFYVGYTGKVFRGQQEMEWLMEVARMLGDINFLVVGGRPDVVEYYRDLCVQRGIDNMCFVGFVSPSEVIMYQRAVDVLVVYFGEDIGLTAKYGSPGKLPEYMASGVPIVAGDYPSVTDLLRHGESALVIPPGKPHLLAKAIMELKQNPDRGRKLAKDARRRVENLVWEKRAKRILERILK